MQIQQLRREPYAAELDQFTSGSWSGGRRGGGEPNGAG